MLIACGNRCHANMHILFEIIRRNNSIVVHFLTRQNREKVYRVMKENNNNREKDGSSSIQEGLDGRRGCVCFFFILSLLSSLFFLPADWEGRPISFRFRSARSCNLWPVERCTVPGPEKRQTLRLFIFDLHRRSRQWIWRRHPIKYLDLLTLAKPIFESLSPSFYCWKPSKVNGSVFNVIFIATSIDCRL